MTTLAECWLYGIVDLAYVASKEVAPVSPFGDISPKEPDLDKEVVREKEEKEWIKGWDADGSAKSLEDALANPPEFPSVKSDRGA